MDRWNPMSEEDETWMEKSMHGQFVLFTDHQAALAKKDEEIARLKGELSIAKAEETLRPITVCQEDVLRENAQLQADLDQVLGEAVKFAELYTNAGVRKRFLCFNEHYHEAMCFLTSPQVQAWRKEGKG